MRKRTLMIGITFVAVLAGLTLALGRLDRLAAGQQQGQVMAPRFEVDPTWPKPLPDGMYQGQTIGLWVDANDHIWAVHRPDVLDDLDQRGLFDDVLVVMCGEMGRTPKISPITVGGKNASGEIFTPGRHHWGDVFPCFFAGAGVKGGQVIGATDRHGGVPVTEGYTPADLLATILHLMGVPADAHFRDAEGRQHHLTTGTTIRALLA